MLKYYDIYYLSLPPSFCLLVCVQIECDGHLFNQNTNMCLGSQELYFNQHKQNQ